MADMTEKRLDDILFRGAQYLLGAALAGCVVASFFLTPLLLIPPAVIAALFALIEYKMYLQRRDYARRG